METHLYVVATPIGNLEDITLRAIRVLSESDFILCEDTRTTKKLLQKYNISTPTISYHTHSKISKINKVLELLKQGKNLSIVSDAGTPTVSDPGSKLIRKIRDELPKVKIIPIPGPSAVVAALSASGFSGNEFLFLGFAPHKKGRSSFFQEIKNSKRTAIFYESPHRILKTIEHLSTILEEDRNIAIFGEITKLYEKSFIGSAHNVLKELSCDEKLTKGEFTILVEGA